MKLPKATVLQRLLRYLTIGEVAEKYEVSEVAVYAKFKRSGLEMPRPAKRQILYLPSDEELLSEYETSRASTYDMAQKYGVSQSCIAKRIQAARKARTK